MKQYKLTFISIIACVIYVSAGGGQFGKTIALFATTIFALMLQPFAMGTIGILSLTIGATIGVFSIQDAVGAFSSTLVWQIVTVFFIARGFVKTGLSKRIAYHIIKFFGHNVLGLSYGFVLSNFSLGPLIPSCAARIGGIMFPIIKSASEALGSSPKDNTQKKIGSFFTLLCLYGNAIVSATFLTAMAGNLIIKSVAHSMGLTLTWFVWFKCSIVPSIICIIAMPMVLYYLYPPTLKDISKMRILINSELETLGKISYKEKQVVGVLFLLLFAWIFGDYFSLDAVLVSFIGVSCLLLTEVLDFEKDILAEKEAWHALVWLSSLLLIAKTLKDSGVLNVLINRLDCILTIFPAYISIIILVTIYGYTHYFFASNSSHISALYAIFVGAAIKIGTPPILAALIFAFTSSIFAGLFYYTSTEAVILYNSEYVSMRDFFIYGLIMTTFTLILWMSVGMVWWKIIGMY